MVLRFLSVFLLTFTVGCQMGPTSALSSVGQDQAEALAGLRAARSLEGCYGGVVADAAADERMARIARQLARKLPGAPITCHCRLLACQQINAFSLPGGRIYITRGLYRLLDSDDLLAAVFAHELAHIVSRDSFKPPCTTPAERLAREISADCRGAIYLHRAGYSADAMVRMLDRISPVLSEGWGERRITAVNRAMLEPVGPPTPRLMLAAGGSGRPELALR